MNLSGVILAGGESRRMGQDKRFLPVEGMPLLAWVRARLQPLVDEVIVVTRRPEELPECAARVVTDIYPGRGVLAGVHAGLQAARGAWAFVMAGDMPLLNPDLVRAMVDVARTVPADIVVPRRGGEFEPLHALYRPAVCAPAAEAALRRGARRIISFYPDVRVHPVNETFLARWDPAGRSFTNINTPEAWMHIQQLLRAPK